MKQICFIEFANAGPMAIFAREGFTKLYICIYRSTNETNSVTLVRAPFYSFKLYATQLYETTQLNEPTNNSVHENKTLRNMSVKTERPVVPALMELYETHLCVLYK